MSDTSRRKFLAATGAGVAAGAVGIGGPAVAGAVAKKSTAATEPVVAFIENPHSGVVSLMLGDREVVVEDHDLVARILNAAGGN